MPVEKNRFGLRVVLVIIGVICQGIGVYWLTNIAFGTDPYTVFNLGLSKILGLSYGTTIFIFNCILFLIVIIFGIKQIGVGTLANMVLVGYSCDFCGWVMGHVLPDGFFDNLKTRIILLVPALVWFIFAASLYMAVDLGQSPYDATPAIIASKFPKVPFMVIRMGWDITWTVIGFFLVKSVGMSEQVGIVTVAIAFFLGPVITLLKKLLAKLFGFK